MSGVLVPVSDGSIYEPKEALHTPRASIGNIEMIAPLLGGKLGACFSGDGVPKNRGSTLEFSRFILWVNPIGDFLCLYIC